MFDVCRCTRRLVCLVVSLLVLGAEMHAATPTMTTISEGLFGCRSGNDKKEAALSFIESALSMSEAVAAKDIVDNDKFKEGLAKVIDGTVECLNASIWAKAR